MSIIDVTDLTKTFLTIEKQPGLVGSLRALARPEQHQCQTGLLK